MTIFQLSADETSKQTIITIYLPQGMTMEEINDEAKKQLPAVTSKLHGHEVFVTGRCTTALAMLLGHELAHVCKSVNIYDPKEDEYFPVIKH